MTPSLRSAFAVAFVALLVALAPPALGAGGQTPPALGAGGQAPPALAAGLPSPPVLGAGGLDWHACGNFQCATLSVPLDYDHAEGRQIDLAVIRQPARNQGQRIGSMFINPGGPGGSAIDFLKGWAPSLPSDIKDRFDVIAFDPRGVGESTPLECHDDIQKLAALPPAPRTDAEWQDVFDADKAFADLCAERSHGILPYLGTVNVARDIDRLRESLGEEKLTYFGYS